MAENKAKTVASKALDDAKTLQVELNQFKSILGVGKRVVVPKDQIHIVSGAGVTKFTLDPKTKVYGGESEENAVYWRNSLTQVIPLRTTTVRLRVEGPDNMGVNVLDAEKVPYTASAHVVFKLDTSNPDVAAESVGVDVSGLLTTIVEVTEAQLLDAAAEMKLEEVLKNRQGLADKARDEVNKTLAALGYQLVLLAISELGGEAYDMLVKQAHAEVTRDTTIKTNVAELATVESNKERQRTESEAEQKTRQKVELTRLGADEAIKQAETHKNNEAASQEHGLAVAGQTRQQEFDQAQHETAMAQIDLQKTEAVAQQEMQAKIRLQSQTNDKVLEKKAAEADADKSDLVQQRDLDRSMKRTQQEAERLELEATSEADREKQVTITHAQSTAQAAEITATGELRRAEAQAEANHRQAEGRINLAEATRAETAAAGLAQADVEATNLKIDNDRVAVERARGLAEAEVERQKVEVSIYEQQQEAQILRDSPELLTLKRLEMEHNKELELARIQANTQIAMMQAMAPHMQLNANLIGSGDNLSNVLGQILAIASGAQYVGEQVPIVGRLLEGQVAPAADAEGEDPAPLSNLLARFKPAINKVVSDMKPRMFASMTVEDLIKVVAPIISGDAELSTQLQELKDNANFKMITSLPVDTLLQQLGITKPATPKDDTNNDAVESEVATS